MSADDDRLSPSLRRELLVIFFVVVAIVFGETVIWKVTHDPSPTLKPSQVRVEK